MKTDYRIEPAGTAFIVIDPAGEQVDTYLTEDAAKGYQENLPSCEGWPRGERGIRMGSWSPLF